MHGALILSPALTAKSWGRGQEEGRGGLSVLTKP